MTVVFNRMINVTKKKQDIFSEDNKIKQKIFITNKIDGYKILTSLLSIISPTSSFYLFSTLFQCNTWFYFYNITRKFLVFALKLTLTSRWSYPSMLGKNGSLKRN